MTTYPILHHVLRAQGWDMRRDGEILAGCRPLSWITSEFLALIASLGLYSSIHGSWQPHDRASASPPALLTVEP